MATANRKLWYHPESDCLWEEIDIVAPMLDPLVEDVTGHPMWELQFKLRKEREILTRIFGEEL